MRCRSCAPVPEEVRRAAGLLERRWTVSIIWASHARRPALQRVHPGGGAIPPATLATRLGELEAAGILERRVVDGRPPRAEYVLTERGARLRSIVHALAELTGE